MITNNEFQSVDATPVQIDATPVQGDAIPQTLIYPAYDASAATLKRLAELMGVSYASLRNRWIKRVETALEGVEHPSLKTPNGSLTMFGWDLMVAYVNRVQKSGESFDSFKSDFQEKFEPTIEPAGELAIMPTTKLARIEMPELPTFDFPSFQIDDRRGDAQLMDVKLAQMLEQTVNFSNQVDEALIQKAAAEGLALGRAIAAAKQAGIAQGMNSQAQNLGKSLL